MQALLVTVLVLNVVDDFLYVVLVIQALVVLGLDLANRRRYVLGAMGQTASVVRYLARDVQLLLVLTLYD